MRYSIFIVLLALLGTSCTTAYYNQPMRQSRARLAAESPVYKDLVSLPPPREKIVAAVYKFRDQTGQYKPSELGTNWSTAVTQGATSILLRAMEESGWFVPIEREGLANLLNERKIIRSSRANYDPNADPNQLLPPLLFAGILLEGGIIGYDTNILTGGIGVRYFGTGASGQYREDRVTIYLRAISTSNGRVLKTVYTSKTILSQQVDVGIFRYVSLQRLLEAETGYSYNEPGEMAVKEAIEKAVQSLIIEGLFENIWEPADPAAVDSSAVVQAYVKEKSEKDLIDVFGARYKENRGRFAIGILGSALFYDGDFPNSAIYGGGEFNIEYGSKFPIAANLNIGYGSIGTNNGYRANVGFAEFSGNIRFFQNVDYTPYFRMGFGAFTEFSNNQEESTQAFDEVYPHFLGEIGFEYMVKEKLGIVGGLNIRYLLTDNIDRQPVGRRNDYLWGGRFGLNWYLW